MATKSSTTTTKQAQPKVTRKRVPAKATAKATATKAQPKAKVKVAPAPAPVAAARRPNRTEDEWDQVTLEQIVPRLQAGEMMKVIRAEFGAGPTIRKHLTRVGYNTKGERITPAKVQLSGKRLAAYTAKRRLSLAAWWLLAHETGATPSVLKANLAKYNYPADLINGRVLSERTRARIAKQAQADA